MTFILLCLFITDMQWFSPIVNGTAPPPCQSFSFTKLDNQSAFLYGGYAPEHGQIKDVYTINFVSWVSWHCYYL